jgi:hypothetical protein
MKQTLSTLLLHFCVSVILATTVAFGGYAIMCSALETAQEEHSQAYIRVRAEREQRLFDDALVFTRGAEQAFRRRLDELGSVDVSDEFDRFFPLMPDGTRRSVPEIFEGHAFEDGDHVHGVGSFMGDGAEMTLEDKRIFLAAFQTVRTVGEAHINRFSSLYFFTPDRRVVIFAPGRDDRLEFYRITAPADFDLRGDEDAALFDRATNPHGAMQCSRLSRFLYTDGGLLGGIGTSIMMNAHLEAALQTPPPHGVNMLFDADGNVIARGDVVRGGPSVQGQADGLDPNLVMAMLRDDPRPNGVVRHPDLPYLIAHSRLEGPSWHFVSFIPLDVIWKQAANWAWALFGLIFLISMIFTSVRWLLSRRRPMRRLMRWRAARRSNEVESAHQTREPRLILGDTWTPAE